MAFVVEDGSQVSGATSYLAVATADAYHSDRGNESWADADTSEKEAALIRATMALDAKYGTSFAGIKAAQSQALAWPRIKKLYSTEGVDDADGYEVEPDTIPQAILNATAEIALIELSERFLSQALNRDDMITSETVGPISTTWSDHAPTVKHYPHVDAILENSGLAASATGIGINLGLTDKEASSGDVEGNIFDYGAYFNLVTE